MGKMMIVFDETYESCINCPCNYEDLRCQIDSGGWLTYENITSKRPDWCPLKKAPEKFKADDKYQVCTLRDNEIFIQGWNACVDELTGNEED